VIMDPCFRRDDILNAGIVLSCVWVLCVSLRSLWLKKQDNYHEGL